jgi:hypothetical protein
MSYKKVSGSVTRPADTTQYAVGDVVTAGTPAVITFTNALNANNGSGKIVKSTLLDSANQATKGQFDLFLFHTAPTIDADNATFTPTDAEMANLVGIIRFATAVGGDLTAGAVGNAIYHGVDITGAYVTPIGTKVASRSLYGVTVVQNTYTPIASEVLTFTLWVE